MIMIAILLMYLKFISSKLLSILSLKKFALENKHNIDVSKYSYALPI